MLDSAEQYKDSRKSQLMINLTNSQLETPQYFSVFCSHFPLTLLFQFFSFIYRILQELSDRRYQIPTWWGWQPNDSLGRYPELL